MRPGRALREQIVACLRDRNFPGLVELAGRVRGLPEQLVRFLFDPTDLLQWRALEGLGQLAQAHPAQVRRVITRLLYMLNEDSGSFGWGAAAALGEIGRGQLSLVADIIPMFCGFLEEKFSRASMLWGIGRLAQVHPESLGEVIPFILACLADTDPQVQALCAWCLGRLKVKEASAPLQPLLEDHRPVALYDQGEMHRTTVSQVAREALQALRPACHSHGPA